MASILDVLRFNHRPQLPVILQSEAAECGLACLAMIASYHGHQMDLNTLRRRYPVSLRGSNLTHLIDLAERLHFSTRALRLELEEINQLQTPTLLHWDMNHFVVLKKVTAQGLVIHDPAQGVRTYSMAEASKHFTGVALELAPTQAFKPEDERERLPLIPIIKNISGLKSSLLKLLGLSVCLQFFALISPFYMQLVVDEAIVSRDFNLLGTLSLAFLLVALVQMGVNFFRGYLVLMMGSMMSLQLANNLMRHVLRLPMSFFEKRHIGDVVSRFGSLGRIKQFLTTDIIEAVVDGGMAFTTLIMMYLYAPSLAYVVLLSVAIYGVVRWVWYTPLKQLREESIVASAKENSAFMESVRGIQSIKIFGQEQQRHQVWQHRYADALNADIRVGKLSLYYNVINGLLFATENVLVVYLGASMVLNNVFSIGMFFAFTTYKKQFEDRATNLINKIVELKMIGLHLERLADLALAEPEDLDDPSGGMAAEADRPQGTLSVVDLSFAYPGLERNVFQHLNITLEAGSSVAIVGPSGCGKTTLVKVMMGLLSPTQGRVLLDGQDIRRYGLHRYRRSVASVMQNDQLLSGSIAENIACFDADLDMARVVQSAQLAAIHPDVLQMPMQYETLIGDMGAALSGGQKQRLLLARALYAQPCVLFLDEATSHLDVGLEQVVNTAIKTLNMTRIIVAHRPETIRSADRILLLTPEGLVEQTPQARSATSKNPMASSRVAAGASFASSSMATTVVPQSDSVPEPS